MTQPIKSTFIVLLTFFWTFAFATPPALFKKGDIRPVMEEMFNYHVEFKELSPLLVRRAFKVYIEQFDREKVYLLQDEVQPFLELENDHVDKVISDYQKDEFPDYKALNLVIQKGVLRSRKMRQEIERELILNTAGIEPGSGEGYLQFASSSDELRSRVRKQLIRYLFSEKRQNEPAWTPQRRQKIFALWERRYDRLENPYLFQDARSEHYFTLHLLKAFAKSLDAHTAFFSVEEAREMRTSSGKRIRRGRRRFKRKC